MKTQIILLIFSALSVFALPIAAQELEIPLKKIYEHPGVSQSLKENPLLVKFTEAHASDTVGIEFTATQVDNGQKWARHTNVLLNGNEGQDGNNEFTSHQVFRIQPFGPDAEDKWEDYLYVARVKSEGKTASMIIQFRCKFDYPDRVGVASPKLELLEIVADKSVIK